MMAEVHSGSNSTELRRPRNVGLSSDSGRIIALPRMVETGQLQT